MSDATNYLHTLIENRERLACCPKHFFPERGDAYELGKKLACQRCGGTMSVVDLGNYISGYEAAGGSGQDIAPGWKS